MENKDFVRPSPNSRKWPLLLNYAELNVLKSHHNYHPSPSGAFPLERNMEDYLRYGFINVDKPHEVPSSKVCEWINGVLKIPVSNHSRSANDQSSGCLVVCLGTTTRLVNTIPTVEEFVVGFQLRDDLADTARVRDALRTLVGKLFQRQLVNSRVRVGTVTVHDAKLLRYSLVNHSGVFRVTCDDDVCVRDLCVQLGYVLGVGAEMLHVRRVKSGLIGERDRLRSWQDVLKAADAYMNHGVESQLRRIVQPLEGLLVNHKRIVLADSAVHSVCCGSWVLVSDVLRVEDDVVPDEEVVVMTTKGEAVALGVALMGTAAVLMDWACGYVAKTELIIMERNTYPRRWYADYRASSSSPDGHHQASVVFKEDL